jgi:thioredoxin-related protein
LKEQAEMKWELPLAEGKQLRATYAIDSYPVFLIIDRQGMLAGRIDGYGHETGFLVKQQLEKLFMTPRTAK